MAQESGSPPGEVASQWDWQLVQSSFNAIKLSRETLRRTENFARSSRFLTGAERQQETLTDKPE